jgi:predicted KAP-like P-loop ATPase
MDKNFSSDRPISNQQDDKFQRYEFAKRIANTIVERESEDCIVIGVYGAWGEGKTSVINFIETELKEKNNIIAIKFNPWRYNDENSLLIQFFQKLAVALDANLKTTGEKIGSLFKKYGKLLKIDIPLIGVNIGDAVEGAGDILADVDIETLKERIGAILKENKSKVVIFIDDIDRLDKVEVHSIFRLVKLTADFLNTTYILSFDEEMVSAAIGERFGAGNQKSGQNFLEKIIQVPLKIPVAQPEALKQFCFQLVDKAINSNNISLTEDEARRFVSEFTSNVLIKLETPRLAVRYGNSLSFSLPLLAGEVNLVDLMLIEAIKIFYPSHYEFVKSNPEYFIGSYSERFSYGKDNDKVSSLKEHLELLGKNLTKKQRSCIQSLLEELFPRLNEVFHNYASYDGRLTNDWFKQKRIVSPKYFNKYFSYAVIKGEISDIAFQNFLADVSAQSIEEVASSIKTLVEQSSPDNFLQKIRSIEEDFKWEEAVKIAKAISATSEVFPQRDSFSFGFGFETPNGQAAIFIYQLIKKHNDKDEQFALAKELMDEAKHFEFAYELNNWLRSGDTPEQKLFTNEQYGQLAIVMIKRALKEADKQPIFEKFPDHVNYIIGSWAEQDRPGLTKYIKGILNKTPNKSIDLLRAFTPTGYSTAVVGPYKTDFTKEQYRYFVSLFDKTYINKIVAKVYSDEDVNAEEVKWTSMREKTQTDLNIVRQFRHWLQADTLTIEIEPPAPIE